MINYEPYEGYSIPNDMGQPVVPQYFTRRTINRHKKKTSLEGGELPLLSPPGIDRSPPGVPCKHIVNLVHHLQSLLPGSCERLEEGALEVLGECPVDASGVADVRVSHPIHITLLMPRGQLFGILFTVPGMDTDRFFRGAAPERVDPQHFGSSNTGATEASNVYLLGASRRLRSTRKTRDLRPQEPRGRPNLPRSLSH
jgi:hypothetical protein